MWTCSPTVAASSAPSGSDTAGAGALLIEEDIAAEAGRAAAGGLDATVTGRYDPIDAVHQGFGVDLQEAIHAKFA